MSRVESASQLDLLNQNLRKSGKNRLSTIQLSHQDIQEINQQISSDMRSAEAAKSRQAKLTQPNTNTVLLNSFLFIR